MKARNISHITLMGKYAEITTGETLGNALHLDCTTSIEKKG